MNRYSDGGDYTDTYECQSCIDALIASLPTEQKKRCRVYRNVIYPQIQRLRYWSCRKYTRHVMFECKNAFTLAKTESIRMVESVTYKLERRRKVQELKAREEIKGLLSSKDQVIKEGAYEEYEKWRSLSPQQRNRQCG
jgi:hypothetical protein